jgi:hypothetical protein
LFKNITSGNPAFISRLSYNWKVVTPVTQKPISNFDRRGGAVQQWIADTGAGLPDFLLQLTKTGKICQITLKYTKKM